MLSLTLALDIVNALSQNMQIATEIVATANSLYRVNVADIHSRLDLPPFTKAAMDGYAILADDNRSQYELIETVPAGSIAQKKLASGKTIKIMTGAPIPINAEKIIRLEYTSENNNIITIHTPELQRNICQKGEDLKQGDLILRANNIITPTIIGSLISSGIETIEIKQQPKIAIIATGDELVNSYELCTAGKIMNVNGPMLKSLCQKYNLEVVSQICVADQQQKIASAINHALATASIVIISGGASAGDFDYVRGAFNSLGLTTHFTSIAIKPGKPTLLASTVDNKLIFGLPGNPVAVYLMFHLLVLNAIQIALGVKNPINITKRVLMQDLERKDTERTEYRPCRLLNNNTIEPITYNGSAHLSALIANDGFFIIPQGIKKLNRNELVDVLVI